MPVRVRAVVVGINHWNDLTQPFWESLALHNPRMDALLVDNGSEPRYPVKCVRLEHTVGYGAALNIGAGANWWDWLLCCNNDCECLGNVTHLIETLRTDTVYGNDWKYDYEGTAQGLPAVVDSAYFLIPRRVWDTIGSFDDKCDAAFEEVDYCLRALSVGFRLDVAHLPIVHLNMHTRRELINYDKRWSQTRDYFLAKHPARKAMQQ